MATSQTDKYPDPLRRRLRVACDYTHMCGAAKINNPVIILTRRAANYSSVELILPEPDNPSLPW